MMDGGAGVPDRPQDRSPDPAVDLDHVDVFANVGLPLFADAGRVRGSTSATMLPAKANDLAASTFIWSHGLQL